MSRRNRGFGMLLCGAAALAVLCGLASFGRVVDFDFAYDDEWTIVKNGYLRWPLLPLLRVAVIGGDAALMVPDATRPAMLLGTWLDFRLFGLDPTGHHVHSLIWYLGCCAVAPLAAYAWTRRPTVAVVAGLWFAVSPLHAETAASVNYREDLIAGLAVLVVVARVLWPSERRDSGLAAALVGAVLLLGLLGKASALAVVPLLGLWLVVSPSGRIVWQRRRKSLTGLAVVGGLWLGWRVGLRTAGLDAVPLRRTMTAADRLLGAARFEVRAIADTMWPVTWAPEYPREPAAGFGWMLLLGAIWAVAWLVRKKSRTMGHVVWLGLVWILAAPIVASPLIGPMNERADRYLFVAVLGAGCLWGAVVDAAVRWLAGAPHAARSRPRLRLALVLGLGLSVGPAIEASSAAAAWRSNATLWRAAVVRRPDAARAWTALSRQRRIEGDLEGADRAVERAIRLDPGLLRARVTRIYNSLARGAVDAARTQIREIDALGGGDQLGMSLARRCAALDPHEAMLCASGRRAPPAIVPESPRGQPPSQ